MNTETQVTTHDIDIELPPLPDLPAYSPEVFDREVKVVSETMVEQLMQAYARAAIEADRKHRDEPVAEVVRDTYGRYSHIKWKNGYKAEVGDKFYLAPQPSEPVAPFQGKVERHSDQSVVVRFPSCRLASEFERNVAAYAEPVPSDDPDALTTAYLDGYYKGRKDAALTTKE